LKKSGRITAGFLTSAAASVGTDPKDLIANNTPRSTLTKTTPMTDLSPAAAAVLRAAGDSEPGIYATIAAALRAAADQLYDGNDQDYLREIADEIGAAH